MVPPVEVSFFLGPGLLHYNAAPVTGLLTFLRFFKYCAAGYNSSWTFCDTVYEDGSANRHLISDSVLSVFTTMEGAALVDDRAGVTFDVELCVPCYAPEAVVDINSIGVVTLGSLPDKVGLFGRRMDAAPSRVLQGRDDRSTRFLVPDNRGVDQNFHDVTIVDMKGERESKVLMSDLSQLRDSWPPVVFTHMKWRQQDLELMRKAAKRTFTQDRPMPCKYCGKVIRCDMHRHVSMFHLDLAQLWRCLVSWCTMWRGSPQDCMDHLRNAHDAPRMLKSACIERYIPRGQ